MNRRSFLLSAAGLIAGPSIVRAGSLMPIFPATPAWMDHINPIWGELISRLPNGRNLDHFIGLIQPGQFYWRKNGRLYDLCQFSRTYVTIKPGMVAVNNLNRGKITAPIGRGHTCIEYAGYHITEPMH